MAKIKVVDGYQKKDATREQVEAYRAFGWTREKRSEHLVKKQTMYTIKRKPAIASNKAIAEAEKKYLKLEKKVCKKKAGFFSVLFAIVGILAAAVGALTYLKMDFGVEIVKTIEDTINGLIPDFDFTGLIAAVVGVVLFIICCACPSGKAKFGKYKKGKFKKLQPKMAEYAKKAEDAVYNLKVSNRALMTSAERKNFDMQNMVTRAIAQARRDEEEDE